MRRFAATLFGILLVATLALAGLVVQIAVEIHGQEDTGWGYVMGEAYMRVGLVVLVPLLVCTLFAGRWYHKSRRHPDRPSAGES